MKGFIGIILIHPTKKLGFKNYRFYNIIADRGDDSGGGLPITKIIDTKIMDEGLLYAFKNCWGLKMPLANRE